MVAFLLFATTITLTVPATDASECPSAKQVGDALNALMPGLVPATAAVGGLRLTVVTLPAGDLRVELVNAQGDIVLHRILPAPPRGHAADCAALGQTVALIVERYLHDVGYEAPPLAPPPPKPAPVAAPTTTPPPAVVETAPAPAPSPAPRAAWRFGVAAAGRAGDAGGLDGDAALALSLDGAGDGAGVGARLSAGLGISSDARWKERASQAAMQTATLRRIPLRLGLYARLAAGPGQLEPGLGGGTDVLLVSAAGPGTADGVHFSPFGDLSLGYSVLALRPVYLRVLSRIALAVPYSFRTLGGTDVWGTPRAYGEVGVELGFAFR